MEIKFVDDFRKHGLCATRDYSEGEIVFVLSGTIHDHPTRESIHIGDGKHILDNYGRYVNHSFNPSVRISSTNVIALHDIKANEEITFNYNESELNMAAPFYDNNILVCGKF
jgi:hypothetical protein